MVAPNEIIIKDTHRGLKYVDGVLADVLGAGRHDLPKRRLFGRTPQVEVVLVDMRNRDLTIKGQEILTADKVADKRIRSEVPRSAIDSSPMLREALEAIASGVFSPDDPNRYRDLIGGLYDHDWFMVAADFDAYTSAQRAVDDLWSDPSSWWRKAALNTARMGWFSSDRTIRQYAEDIWGISL